MSAAWTAFELLSAPVLAQSSGGESGSSLWERFLAAANFVWAHRPEALALFLVLMGVLMLVSRVPLSYNVLNLLVRWRTGALTVSAFVVVVGLLVVMLAFVNGMYQLTVSSGQPGNVLILADGAIDEAFSNLSVTDVSDIENQPGIVTDEQGRPLVSRETYLIANQPLENAPPGRPRRRFLQLRGVDDPARSAAVHGLTLNEGGRWFSEAGVGALPGADPNDPPAVECLLGEGIAREMGMDRPLEVQRTARNRERLDVGDTFSLNDRTWVVVGVFNSAGSSYGSEVWAKQSLIGRMFGKENYTTLVVRTPGPAEAQKLRDFFAQNYTKAKLNAMVETAYFANLSETNVQILVGVIIVTVFTAIGGIFGVMNTMYAAISQRVKDIGVLRLLGFKRWQILVSFLLESLVLALVGGVIGCALGSLADGMTANSVFSGSQGGGKLVVLKITVDLAVLSSGMLLALVMGFLGGLIPSLSAMRLSALEALR
uniref:ABC transporter permease n=1 Tax=Schlesneria paludicola TaxID=360056 RepID=A0A7C4LNU0_9PLAN